LEPGLEELISLGWLGKKRDPIWRNSFRTLDCYTDRKVLGPKGFKGLKPRKARDYRRGSSEERIIPRKKGIIKQRSRDFPLRLP